MSNNLLLLYKFDEFSLNTSQQQLSYRNNPVSLTPKAFQTLLFLVKNRNQVIEKEALLNEVWADTYVEETTLSQNILTLRKTLSKYQKEKDFIVTVPKRGFRFVAEVEEISIETESVFVETTLPTVVNKEILTHQTDEPIKIEVENSKKVSTLIEPARNQKQRSYLLSILSLICIFFCGSATWFLLQPLNLKSPKTTRFTTLVADSKIRKAVTSFDGKYLALVNESENKQSILLNQIAANITLEIVPKLNGDLIGLTFSPDGENIYYAVSENWQGILYRIPLLGGASQMVLKDFVSPVAVSPDNKHLAFIRLSWEHKSNVLVITDLNGKNERITNLSNSDLGFTTSGVAWSPDGKNIAATVNQNNQKTNQLVIINLESSDQKLLTNENWEKAGQPIWEKDGNSLVVAVFRPNSPTMSDELWRISYPDGKPQYLSNGIKKHAGISFNRVTNSIVTIKSERLTSFLSASLDNFKKSNLISTRVGDTCDFPIGADWTNEGKIIYSATESGNADIWTISESGGEKRKITADESAEISPKLSNDGRHLIFLSNRSGTMNVWRANANGTNPVQLTENENIKEINISPDGSVVYFLNQNDTKKENNLWKISINGDQKQQLTTQQTQTPRISPDGKTIAAVIENDKKKKTLALLSAETGEVLKSLEMHENDDLPFLEWAKNGENLLFVVRHQKADSLWKLNLTNHKTEILREWENDEIFRFAVSKDGEKVFYEVGTEINNVVQIELEN